MAEGALARLVEHIEVLAAEFGAEATAGEAGGTEGGGDRGNGSATSPGVNRLVLSPAATRLLSPIGRLVLEPADAADDWPR